MSNIESIKNVVISVAQSPKTAGVVAGQTVASGASQWFNWIPDDIGKAAALVGVILTVVLIRNHIARSRLEQARLDLERERLEWDRRRSD